MKAKILLHSSYLSSSVLRQQLSSLAALPSPKAKSSFYSLWNGPHLLNPKAKRFALLFALAFTRDHLRIALEFLFQLWNKASIITPAINSTFESQVRPHLNCFLNITKPCTCNLSKLKPMLCLNSSSCARSINLLASVSSASLPHACVSNCFWNQLINASEIELQFVWALNPNPLSSNYPLPKIYFTFIIYKSRTYI